MVTFLSCLGPQQKLHGTPTAPSLSPGSPEAFPARDPWIEVLNQNRWALLLSQLIVLANGVIRPGSESWQAWPFRPDFELIT